MSIRSTRDRYGAIAQAIHWMSAFLILALIPLGLVMTRLDDAETQLTLNRIHVTLGVIVAFLTIGRVIWRLIEPTPDPPPMPTWRKLLFSGTHLALYVGIAILASSGIVMLVETDFRPIAGGDRGVPGIETIVAERGADDEVIEAGSGSGSDDAPGEREDSEGGGPEQETVARTTHGALAFIYGGLFIAHVGGVATYQLTKGDVLGRMGVRVRRARSGPPTA